MPLRPSSSPQTWLVPPGSRFRLADVDPGSTPDAPGDRKATDKATAALRLRLRELQDRLFAEGSRSVLLVLQAMDGGGKDGTVKSVFAGVHPTAVDVHSFNVPTKEELAHDFLWRIHQRMPQRGRVGIFNRSHYEDVLAVRVRNIAPPSVWKPRFGIINEFEHAMSLSGTTFVKVMLHISKEEQRLRLQSRIDRPEKRWKFHMGDLEDRKLWDQYQAAYEDTLRRTSTATAPWFVVPADKKWYRDFAVLSIMVDVLEGMRPRYPQHPELDGIVVD